MIDEGALRERAALGARFKEVLPDIREALTGIEAEYTAELLGTHDSQQRDNLWRAVQIVHKLKSHFGEIVSSGAVASHQLTEIKRLR